VASNGEDGEEHDDDHEDEDDHERRATADAMRP